MKYKFWTSRGYAVADVNYGGSSGHGREYRDRLNGKWGIVDVRDTIECAKYLSKMGMVDEKKICISGGSAGGYVVLSVVTITGAERVFAAATSYYGVSSILELAQDTHKFECKYMIGLVGCDADTEENRQIYRDRCVVISFNGIKLKRKFLDPQSNTLKILLHRFFCYKEIKIEWFLQINLRK